ncbi:C4-dicarboxylate TRAP transporter substrate-binding protein [Paracoccus sp. CPCC 101403]|uniref:C4-dicarboxylate TRAP transporter substrate-binding protein n=2 Tax=Paracoccus broussonetiae TaxID=3075834 RepID=A0ABU3E9S2_9RHOB|nr:C4-dicarboxylate TRAP transporter substrate-binding protein [Paracoccus sp. CPCC 101403]MDT1060979.1 C4-dicarboxylate TRAP transporter substrate-binding protein [Paracoccus sp. CPCC 101403]
MRLFKMLATAAAIALTLPAISHADTKKLRFTTSQVNPDEPIVRAMKTFAERVNTRTEGRLELEVLTGDQLGPQKKVNEMIASGATLVSATDYGQLSTFVPDVGVIAGPYVFKDVAAADKLFAAPVFKDMEAELEAKGFKVLMPSGLFGLRHVIGPKAYRTPADMAGVTIRVPSSPVMVATFTAFGARPTELPWGDVYNALQSNVVDAAEAPFGSAAGAKLQETRKVISKTGHQMMFTAWVTNKAFFDGLDPADQQALLEEGQTIAKELTAMTLETDERYAKDLQAQGVEIVGDVDVAAFQDAAKNAFDAVPGLTPGIVDKVRAAVAN